jgi:GNAT superfamily N-acetyltransferase
MRFRPDWLRRVLHVPYVPTLGPVHPDTLCVEVFDEVVAASSTGLSLPFDKDRRWSARKTEIVLAGEISHGPDATIIPTWSRRGLGTIKTYVYSATAPETLSAATRRWCAAFGAHTGRVIWFHPDNPGTTHRTTTVLLKVFGDRQPAPAVPATTTSITDLDTCPPAVRHTFGDLARHLAEAGFRFLHGRWQAGQIDGPILVAVADRRVIGAIGPLHTMPDRRGHLVMLPQYLGVLPEHRGRGHGRALWRRAAQWGEQHHAAYQLLQAAAGQSAERLFRSEGLTTLGFATAVPA